MPDPPTRIGHSSCTADDGRQSFRTAPKPVGPYGAGHRNICLNAPWHGHLILDVIHEDVGYVEVLYRSPPC